MKSPYLSILVLSTILLSTVNGGVNISKSGTVTAQFLKIGIGARAMGMGGASVASVNDATALFWNPGAIADFSGIKTNMTNTQWLLDTKLNFVGMTVNLGRTGVIGFSATVLTMGDMKVRTVELPEGTGEYFSAKDLAFGVAYGKRLTDFFSIGFHGKYIRQQIWHTASSSIAIDVGTLYSALDGRVLLGASVSNFGSKMQFTGRDLRINYDQNPDQNGDNEYIPAMLYTDRWDIPLTFRVGVAVDLLQFSYGSLKAEIDAVHPNDNYEQINVGTELQVYRNAYLRVGYQSVFLDDAENGLTVGGGLHCNIGETRLRADYAYASFGRLNYVSRFGITLEL
ncbi:MAG: PorV/PorQ family protein [FCB group bacterium]|nr:PorV/PorQ family protein [FCB group bacterium]